MGVTGHPIALTIAGSDPSGGAGIQADLKTFSALGAYGTCVITALTAQNTRGVTGVLPVPPDFVTQQLSTLFDDVRVDAIKIGMLGGAPVVEAVHEFLAAQDHPTVVLDPVMVATSGDPLLEPDAVEALRRLLPLASLITPNVPETAALLGAPPATDERELREQARALLDLGIPRALVKGGHLTGAPEAVDVLAGPGYLRVLRAPRVPTPNTHGTGCTLSSAIAALRPQRAGWREATAEAKAWLSQAIASADRLAVGSGSGPVHHFHGWWDGPRR